jgi:Protein of unknown function (DUF3460)
VGILGESLSVAISVTPPPGKMATKGSNMSLLSSIFQRPDYTSEISQFIDQMKAQKPTLEAEQLAGRALLWDKQVDRSAQAEYREGNEPQKPYVYQTKG